jgi:hypothetical protein
VKKKAVKQQPDPPYAAIAVVVAVLIVGFLAWRSFARPRVQVHKIQFGAGTNMAAKERMRYIIDQSVRTAPGSFVPPHSGGQ